jgi:hypothetical protein
MAESLIVLAVVVSAAGYIGARVLRTVRAAKNAANGCVSDCGCV